MTLLPRSSLATLVLLLTACGSGPAPDSASRTLAAPPDLQVGESWEVVVDPELVGITIPTRLVVTRREGGREGIGIPPGQFSQDFLVLHVPIRGDLELDTFAWRVMWDDFEALRFPLEEGRTWTSDFHGRDVEAVVSHTEGNRAWVTMTGEGEHIELTYDADMRMITEDGSGWASE